MSVLQELSTEAVINFDLLVEALVEGAELSKEEIAERLACTGKSAAQLQRRVELLIRIGESKSTLESQKQQTDSLQKQLEKASSDRRALEREIEEKYAGPRAELDSVCDSLPSQISRLLYDSQKLLTLIGTLEKRLDDKAEPSPEQSGPIPVGAKLKIECPNGEVFYSTSEDVAEAMREVNANADTNRKGVVFVAKRCIVTQIG